MDGLYKSIYISSLLIQVSWNSVSMISQTLKVGRGSRNEQLCVGHCKYTRIIDLGDILPQGNVRDQILWNGYKKGPEYIKLMKNTCNFMFIYRFSSCPKYVEVAIAVEGLQSVFMVFDLSREGSLSCHTCCDTGPRWLWSLPKDHSI